MNKVLFLLFLLISLFIISCSNNQTVAAPGSEISTLKKSIKDKETNIIWTKELEPNALSYEVEYHPQEEENVNYDYELFSLIGGKENIYPDLFEFSNTDISKLSDEKLNKISDILRKITSNMPEINENFESKYVFNYVLFIEDVKKNWQKKMKTPYPFDVEIAEADNPENVIETSTVSNQSNGESKNNDEVEEEKNTQVSVIQLFDKWILGEPFIGEELIQVPVRFIKGNKYLDCVSYFNNDENLKACNITIVKWGNNYER